MIICARLCETRPACVLLACVPPYIATNQVKLTHLTLFVTSSLITQQQADPSEHHRGLATFDYLRLVSYSVDWTFDMDSSWRVSGCQSPRERQEKSGLFVLFVFARGYMGTGHGTSFAAPSHSQ